MERKNGHILIVEDELIVGHSIQMRLELHGYVVDGMAKSGEDALALLETTRPDLILMDIRLSGRIDGIDAAERIRRDYHIPVIFLTAYSDDETLARAKITEPFGYIIKPFETRELVNNIEIALYRQKMANALQASEARFRGLFENAIIGLVLMEPSGAIVEVNNAMLELLAVQDISDRRVTEAIARIAPGSEPQRAELRTEHSVERPDGSSRILEVTSAEIPKGANSPPLRALFVEDVTELRTYENELRDRQLALRSLFVNEETIRERERTSLSRDIHDVLGQMLTAHKMDLHWLRSKGELSETATEMIDHVDEMISFVKRVCSELRDSVLDDFGFDTALVEHVKQFSERSGISVDLDTSGSDGELGHDLAVSLLRILQEALTNVARHAQARSVSISSRRDGDDVEWLVVDDGVGFDPSIVDISTSLGLVGMNERAASWGGSVSIESASGAGTQVTIRVPADTTAGAAEPQRARFGS